MISNRFDERDWKIVVTSRAVCSEILNFFDHLFVCDGLEFEFLLDICNEILKKELDFFD